MSRKLTILSLGYTKDLLKDLKSDGDTLNRLKFYAGYLEKYLILVLCLRKEGLIYRSIDNMEITPTNGRGYLHALWRMYFLSARYLKTEKVDVIQAQEAYMTGLVGLLLKWRFKKPLNICVYGSNPFDKHWRRESWFNFLVAPLAKFVLRRTNSMQVDGTLTKKRLLEVGIGSEKIFFKPLIPAQLTDFSKVSGEVLSKELKENGKFEQILLFIGRMAKQKNIPFLLKGFKEILKDFPKARLVMIGDGYYKSVYEKLSNDSVLWLGAVNYDDLKNYYKAADLFVMSSYYEGFPRVFMEASAAGLPVVTTMVSGVGDGIIDNENGLVSEQGDLEGWIKNVKNILSDPVGAAKFRSRAVELAKEKYGKPFLYDKVQIDLWHKLAK